MSGLIPLPPGTQVFAVLDLEHETYIDGPLVGLALAVRNPLATGAGDEESRVLTLDPSSPTPGAQLVWFRVGVDAVFSREAAERLAADGRR